ncbi:hypothetical protein K457DRAFT_141751 [Linnemannia elongata AG-77]|uniref:Uncharacterized protein n=1 Tax=Linnemannia elongata AG-77 TaxID=1314771 RepID=A0A197JJE9_9FUNG|nr:hypothetical protein K457DRAFT_141751 [Linnemannia elongata AG-77]
MARSTTLLLLLLSSLLLTTFLPILNHHHHICVLAVPVPIPVFPILTTNEPAALAIELSNPSTIKKRQLLGSLLGRLPSFRNEGGNAVQGGGVPGENTANIGAR